MKAKPFVKWMLRKTQLIDQLGKDIIMAVQVRRLIETLQLKETIYATDIAHFHLEHDNCSSHSY